MDPHIAILQLDPKECPPDHYVLLGLPRYTSNPEQIQAAANEQIRFVRPFCARYPTEGTQLLNELTKAKLCLLDDDERAAYDDQLRQSENAVALELSHSTLNNDFDSFADVLGDELDKMSEEEPDGRARRCPHCGSGLFDQEKHCHSCTSGLADGSAWATAKCPECFNALRRGSVYCVMCDTDLSITDVIGCIPSHVPGSVKPFECQKRKKLRAGRQAVMETWSKETGTPPASESDANPPKAPKRRSKDKPKSPKDPMRSEHSSLAETFNVFQKSLGADDDVRERWVARFRRGLARCRQIPRWCEKWHVTPRNVASSLILAAFPLLGLYLVLRLLNSSSDHVKDLTSNAAEARGHRQHPFPPTPAAPPPEDDTADLPSHPDDNGSRTMTARIPETREPEMSEAELRMEALDSDAKAAVSRLDRDEIDTIHATFAMRKEVEQFLIDVGSEHELRAQADDLKRFLVDNAATAFLEALNHIQATPQIGSSGFDAVISLLDDPDAVVLNESRSWAEIEDAAESLTYETTDRDLARFLSMKQFDEAARFIDAVEPPRLIAGFTTELRSKLGNSLRTAVRGFVEEVNLGSIRHQQPPNPADLKALLTLANEHPELQRDINVESLEKELAYSEFLHQCAGVTTLTEAKQMLIDEEYKTFLKVLPELTILKKQSYVKRRPCWYVVSLSIKSQTRIQAFEGRFQTAFAIVRARSEFEMETNSWSGVACASKEEADKINYQSQLLHRFRYPEVSPPGTRRR